VTGLRERKKTQTRIDLSWAAVRLVVELGFDHVRVEDIAEAAGVSVRTFRNYFATKADAVADRHRERMLQIAEELRGRPAEEPLWTALEAAVRARFALGQDERDHPDRAWAQGVRLMVEDPALQGAFQKANAEAREALAVAVGRRTGTDPAVDLYPDLVAGTVGVLVSAVSERWIRADPPAPIGGLFREAFATVRGGLAPPAVPSRPILVEAGSEEERCTRS
jgi:AcrR family transcriptional regulator